MAREPGSVTNLGRRIGPSCSGQSGRRPVDWGPGKTRAAVRNRCERKWGAPMKVLEPGLAGDLSVVGRLYRSP